ncbi:MAG: TIR domain-containing protein [Methanoregula sp.]|jgi:hypothetical protein|nr:TIR domain-containing protein [Methanoregula sp.]
MNKTKLFVSFAPEDKKEGKMLSDQCRNPFSTFEVIGGSEEGQGNENGETQTRELIKQARVVLMVIGKNTANAANVIWEIKVAREAGIPVLGVFIDKAYQESLPETFGSGPVIEWNWEYVYNTILRLVK